MEIRTLAIIGALVASIAATRGGPIQAYPLDERIIYTIRISRDEPTTCVFPGALSALEGANLSAQAADAPPVLLSYQSGASFFSVRALRDDAAAAINVVFRGRVYVLNFRGSDTADRAITFLDEPIAGPARQAKRIAPDVLRSLLDRAKNHDRLAAQYPALMQTVERATPNTITLYPDFNVTLMDVFRFDAEDTLVFGVRAENRGDTLVRFDPSGLAVRVGSIVYPATIADTTGEIPAHGFAAIWFAVTGNADGGRANLSVRNTFSVLVPRLP